MNTAPDPHERQRKLEAIEARLLQHETTARRTTALVMLMATLALALVVGHPLGG